MPAKHQGEGTMLPACDKRIGRSRIPLGGIWAAFMIASIAVASAQTTPQSSAAAEPVLPERKPGSPVVESLVARPPLEVRKSIARHVVRHAVRQSRRGRPLIDLDRPALAGVELLAPLPRPGQPPHIVVPLPAYALDEVATPLITPPPPVTCRPVRREAGLPDPQLYREVTVACLPDNP